jgi:predicted nucleotidyltransferase component of viral defense system
MKLPNNYTKEHLFLWFIHRISEVFKEKAIMKGGFMLRLLDCPRSTVDIDYIFVPFKSKKEILNDLLKIANELEDVKVEHFLSSKNLKIIVKGEIHSIQIEANTDLKCKAIPASTEPLAKLVSQIPRIINIMSPDVALSHKIAAWNERRLVRDLYDIYYFYKTLLVLPDALTLEMRLNNINSRIPSLKTKKHMSLNELANEMREAVKKLSMNDIESELFGIVPSNLLPSLDFKIRAAVNELMDKIVT